MRCERGMTRVEGQRLERRGKGWRGGEVPEDKELSLRGKDHKRGGEGTRRGRGEDWRGRGKECR